MGEPCTHSSRRAFVPSSPAEQPLNPRPSKTQHRGLLGGSSAQRVRWSWGRAHAPLSLGSHSPVGANALWGGHGKTPLPEFLT